MTRILYLYLFFICISCNAQKWEEHKNDEYDFIIKHPANWVISKSKSTPEEVFFIHEPASDSLKILTNIQIKISSHFDIPLDLRAELKENGWKQSDIYENVKILSKKRTKFNNVNAYEYVCSANVSNIKTKWKQIIFIQELYFIEISVTSSTKKFNENQKTTEEIVNSFLFQNQH